MNDPIRDTSGVLTVMATDPSPLPEILEVLKRIEAATELGNRMAYNQKEAAQLLGMHRQTLAQETKLGRIRRTYRRMYSKAEIERYLAEGLKHNEYLSGKAA